MSWLLGLAAKVFGEEATVRLRRFFRDYVWGWRFGVVAWIVVVAVVASSREGADAVGDWRWWLLGAAGVAVIVVAAAVRRLLPLRPLVLVARFHPLGAATAADAETIRQRVYEELAGRAGAAGMEVDTLDEVVDATNAFARGRALGLARSRRCPVVVAASVSIDEELRFSPWILAPSQIRKPIGRADGRVTRTVAAKATSLELATYKNAEAAEAAQLAQLALGMALVGTRHRRSAQRILEAVDPPTYESLYMAAFAAFLDDRYEEAAAHALRALEIERRPRAFGIAIWSLVETGHVVVARELAEAASKITGDQPVDTEDAAGYLLAMGMARLLAATFEEMGESVGKAGEAVAAMKREGDLLSKRLTASRAYHVDGDDTSARAILEPLVSHEAASANDLALYAAAAARQGDPAAREWAERAAAALPSTPDEGSTRAWTLVAEAYGYLGDDERTLSLLAPLAEIATYEEWLPIGDDPAFEAMRATDQFQQLDRQATERYERQERSAEKPKSKRRREPASKRKR